jgi:N-acetylneuraminic acid mutarotase
MANHKTPDGFSAAVLHVALKKGVAEIRRLADLPEPRAMMSAAATATFVYLAGGQLSPAKASRALLAIPRADLLAGRAAWRQLPVWDGPARFFAQVAACGDNLYLAGGSDLVPGPAGQPVREFLSDAHRYTPQGAWEKLPALPRPAQAGLAACQDNRFYLFGGSDGALSEELREKHPGFRRDVLEYDPRTRTWREAGEIPASPVTTGIARWNGDYVIAGGEDRPGHRSAQVASATIQPGRQF